MSINSGIAVILARQAYIIKSAGLFTDETNAVSKRPQVVRQTPASCRILHTDAGDAADAV